MLHKMVSNVINRTMTKTIHS